MSTSNTASALKTNVFRIIGPPGTGKTTWLISQVERAVAAYCQRNGGLPCECRAVMLSSLTRAAANEIRSRGLDIPPEQVGTLHAHALRALGEGVTLCVSGEPIDEWNEWCRQNNHFSWMLSGKKDHTPDQGRAIGAGRGDNLLHDYHCERARLRPRELWMSSMLAFAKEYERWKAENEYRDFSDVIHDAWVSTTAAPGCPAVLMVDEAQDHDRAELRLIHKWADNCEKLIIVGDPDQCQPGETLVLTSQEAKRLDQLDPATDRLVSFDRHSSTIVGKKDGYTFQKASRFYTGRIMTVSAAGRHTRCTHDHRWPVKWNKDANANVVYMMRLGDRWRIGWCQMFGATEGLHLGARARLEKAEAVWVLGVFATKAEASQYENVVAIRYGLPLIMFQPKNGKGDTTVLDIAAVYDQLDPVEQAERAHRCLFDHNLDFRQPLIDSTHRYEKQGKRTSWIVRACNLLPGLMQVPVPNDDGRTVTWCDIKLASEAAHNFPVFSLNVEPHHNYIADGIVTMNNLYEWRGADADAFYEVKIPEENLRVLSQSYRVPRAVHACATKIIQRCHGRAPVAYLPRDADGSVRQIDSALTDRRVSEVIDMAMPFLRERKRVMFLASCEYMLGPAMSELKERGIPFWNPFSRDRGRFNPLTPAKGTSPVERLLFFLMPQEKWYGAKSSLWSWHELHEWSEVCKEKGLFKHGVKKDLLRRSKEDDCPMTFRDVRDCFEHSALDAMDKDPLNFLLTVLAKNRRSTMEFAIRVLRKYGMEELKRPPCAIVGTIHSVKGGEAEVVFLSPDLSLQGHEGYESRRGRNATHRLFYVATTRAKEKLFLCEPGTRRHYDW